MTARLQRTPADFQPDMHTCEGGPLQAKTAWLLNNDAALPYDARMKVMYHRHMLSQRGPLYKNQDVF